MRNLSTNAISAAIAQSTDEVFLLLLTISHDTLTQPIRVVRNNENITSRGNLFVAMAFDITLPQDDGDTLPTVQLTLDNVDRAIVETIRNIKSPPTVTLEIILASSPNYVEMAIYDMELKSVTYNDKTVTGNLVIEDILNQKFPATEIDTKQYPGLFDG